MANHTRTSHQVWSRFDSSAASGALARVTMTVVVLTLIAPSLLLAKSWKDELIQKVTAIYPETDRSIWNLENIKAGGKVMVLTQDGALGSLSTDSRYYGTDVKDGKLSTEGAPMGRNSQLLKKGQRVVLTSVKIIEYQGSDVLRLFFLTADTIERVEGGNTTTRRYKGSLDYFFPGGYLPTADFADVKKAINAAIVAESEYQDAGAATVSLGMTPAEVESVLGKPSKVVDLGNKKIFVYADIKITFMDGKVADVQ
ncbi:MAG TPA: hypothetical protein VJS37_04440 [Terriglobales bacterium]|nr:hypothetical protein [Terriglobales bacterium]